MILIVLNYRLFNRNHLCKRCYLVCNCPSLSTTTRRGALGKDVMNKNDLSRMQIKRIHHFVDACLTQNVLRTHYPKMAGRPKNAQCVLSETRPMKVLQKRKKKPKICETEFICGKVIVVKNAHTPWYVQCAYVLTQDPVTIIFAHPVCE